MTKADPIKLRAEDAEDLAVIAACLQDAIACLAEMAYEPDDRRFALVVERFCWEDRAASGERARGLPAAKAGLHFETVRSVKLRGIDQRRRGRVLELLTITSEPAGQGTAISLLFAGGAEIRLEAERVACRLMDLETPRPTRLRPSHPLGADKAP